MKKFLATTVTVAAILSATVAPTFANVIHSNGTSGKPTLNGISNTGSVQAQTNRSVTGSAAKATNDSWRGTIG